LRARSAPVIGDDAVRDAEQPRAQRARRVVAVQPAVHDDEHVVREIFAIAIVDSEPAQRVPDVVELLTVDLFERSRHAAHPPREAENDCAASNTRVMESARQNRAMIFENQLTARLSRANQTRPTASRFVFQISRPRNRPFSSIRISSWMRRMYQGFSWR